MNNAVYAERNTEGTTNLVTASDNKNGVFIYLARTKSMGAGSQARIELNNNILIGGDPVINGTNATIFDEIEGFPVPADVAIDLITVTGGAAINIWYEVLS